MFIIKRIQLFVYFTLITNPAFSTIVIGDMRIRESAIWKPIVICLAIVVLFYLANIIGKVSKKASEGLKKAERKGEELDEKRKQNETEILNNGWLSFNNGQLVEAKDFFLKVNNHFSTVNGSANWGLSLIYESNDFAYKDEATSLKYLKAACKREHVEAMYHYYSKIYKINPDEAKSYLKKAKKMGHEKAFYLYAKSLLKRIDDNKFGGINSKTEASKYMVKHDLEMSDMFLLETLRWERILQLLTSEIELNHEMISNLKKSEQEKVRIDAFSELLNVRKFNEENLKFCLLLFHSPDLKTTNSKFIKNKIIRDKFYESFVFIMKIKNINIQSLASDYKDYIRKYNKYFLLLPMIDKIEKFK